MSYMLAYTRTLVDISKLSDNSIPFILRKILAFKHLRVPFYVINYADTLLQFVYSVRNFHGHFMLQMQMVHIKY